MYILVMMYLLKYCVHDLRHVKQKEKKNTLRYQRHLPQLHDDFHTSLRTGSVVGGVVLCSSPSSIVTVLV